jgi:hypothetical protein
MLGRFWQRTMVLHKNNADFASLFSILKILALGMTFFKSARQHFSPVYWQKNSGGFFSHSLIPFLAIKRLEADS